MNTITGFDEKSNGWNKAVVQSLGGVRRADALLRGELRVSEIGQTPILVDRSVRPIYPEWVKEITKETRDLEATGPKLFSPNVASLFQHPKQKRGGRMAGKEIYSFLRETGFMEFCYSLRDGEILQKNPSYYPYSWIGKNVFLWKTVVLDCDGNLCVPHVSHDDYKVYFGWFRLSGGWCTNDQAAVSES